MDAAPDSGHRHTTEDQSSGLSPGIAVPIAIHESAHGITETIDSQTHAASSHFPDAPTANSPPALRALGKAPATSPNEHHAFAHVDPDDFYKSYRSTHSDDGPDILPMAASVSSSAVRPSFRSNGDGTAPKLPSVPSDMAVPRQSVRSVSSPLDRTSSTAPSNRSMPSGKPSVKDLRKRFDQNDGLPQIPFAPPPHVAPLVSSGRSAADEVSRGHSQSFASRIGKPRAHDPKSPVSPPRTDQHAEHTSPPRAEAEGNGLLFGEILPDSRDASTPGYGIESGGVADTKPRQRSLSNVDTFVSSPSSRHGHRDQPQPTTSQSSAVQRPRQLSRAQSEDAVAPTPRVNHTSPTNPQNTSTSKIPVSTKRFDSPSNSSSPHPTRPSSPTALKRYQASGRPSKGAPGAARSKTPTQLRALSPQASGSTGANARLQAYVSTQQPMLSPPLRSSRPRQPVSTAATASSRMKRREKSRSGRNGEGTSRRRKPSVGPIDYEQRRQHIKLAYTKSIRESEAQEARLRAAQRQREALAEVQNVPRDLHTTEATSEQPLDSPPPTSEPESAQRRPDKDSKSPVVEGADATVPYADSNETKQTQSVRPIPTLDESIIVSTGNDGIEESMDSPTLGLPGSFPDYAPPLSPVQPPLSAVSATTETTEFDNEAQASLVVNTESPLDSSAAYNAIPSRPRTQSAHQRAEYKSPFEEDNATRPEASVNDQSTFLGKWPPPLDARSPHLSADEEQQFHDAQSRHQEETNEQSYPASPLDSLADSTQGRALPFRQHNSECELECEAPPDEQPQTASDDDRAVANACLEEEEDHSVLRSLHGYYGPASDDPQSYRASTCASSEAEPYHDRDHSHYGGLERLEPGAKNFARAAPPHHSYNVHRQSAWTDFSVDSTDRSELEMSPAVANFQDPRPVNRPQVPHATVDHDNAVANDSESVHQLPEPDMGEGFTVPYLAATSGPMPTYMPSPDHEPPPIPVSAQASEFNSRASSAYYEQDQYDSALLSSERESDEYMSHVETSRSVDSTSLATTDQYASTQTPADSDTKSLAPGGEELSDKERHRLIQRRNVIKELIDTEAVFVRDMNIVEEIYKGTAEACPKLDDKTIKLIFRNSDQIIAFHTAFLAELKEAVADVYTLKSSRAIPRDDSSVSTPSFSTSGEPSDARDRATSLGPVFRANMEQMKVVHEGFLRASDPSAKRLIQIQQDPTVQVWLNECNEVAKDLTAAWDLDSLLIKPMQRITKYPNLIITLLQHTPQDHPDRAALTQAKDTLETAIIDINKTKKNFELVGQIVGRKRKESDVKAGFARAFGKRVDKLQASGNRPAEDADYAKLNEKFGDDYLRLQVVLRDVEFYTRQVSAYVHEFLQYMSSIELVMRLQPGSYPELESKWVQFNISVRDLEKVALEDHLARVRKHVIEPFELVIKAYGNPSLAMKKREKRRLDYERSEQLKRSGKGLDPKLKELVEQYDALNDTLKKELPQLSALTERVGNICLGNFVNIQAEWYAIWMDKMKIVLGDCPDLPDIQEIVSTFQQDFPYAQEQLANIGILNSSTWGRTSLTASMSTDDTSLKPHSRPSDVETRGRGYTVNGDLAPTLPTPDFGRHRSGSFAMSPSSGGGGGGGGVSPGLGNVPSPNQYYYRDYYSGINNHLTDSASNKSPEMSGDSSRRSVGNGATTGAASTRPSTGRSYESGAMPRQSIESSGPPKRDSTSVYGQEPNRYSNMFHSALPLSDGPDDSYKQASRSSSRERAAHASDGYNVLWLAASLFEFNISTTKHEAGYPYLTYQAGEIFDVIAEKGELWLAKNQDDPTDEVGWIWSKHFAKLADS